MKSIVLISMAACLLAGCETPAQSTAETNKRALDQHQQIVRKIRAKERQRRSIDPRPAVVGTNSTTEVFEHRSAPVNP